MSWLYISESFLTLINSQWLIIMRFQYIPIFVANMLLISFTAWNTMCILTSAPPKDSTAGEVDPLDPWSQHVPTPQILSSVLTADLSPSGAWSLVSCWRLAATCWRPWRPGDGATKLVLILAGALQRRFRTSFFGTKMGEWNPIFFWTKKGRLAWQSVVWVPNPPFCLASCQRWFGRKRCFIRSQCSGVTPWSISTGFHLAF